MKASGIVCLLIAWVIATVCIVIGVVWAIKAYEAACIEAIQLTLENPGQEPVYGIYPICPPAGTFTDHSVFGYSVVCFGV